MRRDAPIAFATHRSRMADWGCGPCPVSVGGQGLNLAIWDGVTLGRALARHETEVEKTLRDRGRSVLRFTHFDYLMLSTKWRSIQYLRNSYWKFAGRFPRSAAWFFTLISGVW